MARPAAGPPALHYDHYASDVAAKHRHEYDTYHAEARDIPYYDFSLPANTATTEVRARFLRCTGAPRAWLRRARRVRAASTASLHSLPLF